MGEDAVASPSYTTFPLTSDTALVLPLTLVLLHQLGFYLFCQEIELNETLAERLALAEFVT